MVIVGKVLIKGIWSDFVQGQFEADETLISK